MIYVNKTENRIAFGIRTEYYLELLTSETMKLPGSTKIRINKVNSENASHLEITEVGLTHCNTVNNDYQQDLRVMHTFVLNKAFGLLLDISPKMLFLLKYSLLIKILKH